MGSKKEEAFVSFGDLWDYLGKEVDKRARALRGKSQTPVINARDLTHFYLCHNQVESVPAIPKVFILHDPSDNPYTEMLKDQLGGLAKRGKIQHWDPGDILHGSISQAMDQQLQDSQIIVLLVSADYLSSDDCYDWQQKAAATGKPILPVVVRPCLYDMDDLIDELDKEPKKEGQLIPLSSWDSQDLAMTQVAHRILRIARDLQS